MPSVAVVGAQWGDEGKGKVTHLLAQEADMVVRSQGGSNAGHTVVVGDQVYSLHLLPSGILYPGCRSVIGNGVVVDPELILKELDYLEGLGVDISGLALSDRAHLVLPYHQLLDGLEESTRGERKIGTTLRGIGPAYADKNARVGLRVVDLMDRRRFPEMLRGAVDRVNHILDRVYGHPSVDYKTILEMCERARDRLAPYVTDTAVLVNDALDRGERVVFEGSQGTLLDVDHGTYPYVTSSHPVAGGVTIGSGVGPTRIDRVVGVVKAYTTRVGDGPMPTELADATGERIREAGHEYGTTTGRARRVGWIDAVMLRYARRVNGLTDLALNHLDVLSGMDEVKIAVAYETGGEALSNFPASLDVLRDARPVYRTLQGWPSFPSGADRLEDLPAGARAYIDAIEEEVGVGVSIISTGRERGDRLVLRDPFRASV